MVCVDACMCVLEQMLQPYRITQALGQLRGPTSACTREDRVTTPTLATMAAHTTSRPWHMRHLQGGGEALLSPRSCVARHSRGGGTRHPCSGCVTSATSSEPAQARPQVPFLFFILVDISHVLAFCGVDLSIKSCIRKQVLLLSPFVSFDFSSDLCTS